MFSSGIYNEAGLTTNEQVIVEEMRRIAARYVGEPLTPAGKIHFNEEIKSSLENFGIKSFSFNSNDPSMYTVNIPHPPYRTSRQEKERRLAALSKCLIINTELNLDYFFNGITKSKIECKRTPIHTFGGRVLEYIPNSTHYFLVDNEGIEYEVDSHTYLSFNKYSNRKTNTPPFFETKYETTFTAIMALGKNGQLSLNNKIPWDCKEDSLFFQNKIKNNPIIVGRKTFESMPKKVLNLASLIVVISSRDIEKDINTEYEIVSSLDEALELIESFNYTECFICGGQKIYEEFRDKKIGSFIISEIDYNGESDRNFDISTIEEDYLIIKEKIIPIDKRSKNKLENIFTYRINLYRKDYVKKSYIDEASLSFTIEDMENASETIMLRGMATDHLFIDEASFLSLQDL